MGGYAVFMNEMNGEPIAKVIFYLKAPFLSYGHPSPGGGRIILWRNDFPCPHRGKGIEG
jgi:hypothetical protein